MTDFDELPPVKTGGPCRECPWANDSAPGWLGPYTAAEWLTLAHSDQPIACHKTIEEDESWSTPGIRQCAGAAQFRRNVDKKPRHPKVASEKDFDDTFVFATDQQFRDHHERRSHG